MSELLTREQELIHINQQLNHLADNAKLCSTACNYPNIKDGGKNLSKVSTFINCATRFGTYQKHKGPSTLLKNKGAGDINSDNNYNNNKAVDGSLVPLDNTVTYSCNKNAIGQLAARDTWKTNANYSKVKTPADQAVISSRTDNTRNNVGATFTRRNGTTKLDTFVKYRNPDFKSSSSLEHILEQNNIEHLSDKKFFQITENGLTKKLSTDSYIKLLKDKLSLHEEDQKRYTHELSKQKMLLEHSIENYQALEKQRDTAYNNNKQLSEKVRQMETQLEHVNGLHREQTLVSTNQQKECETLKRELRILQQNYINLENRLIRNQEELETARNTMTAMKAAERDLNETKRHELEAKDKQIKSLTKQRSDLLNAYKKQLFMIDNLKQQNICLEQATKVQITEKEFNKIFDLK